MEAAGQVGAGQPQGSRSREDQERRLDRDCMFSLRQAMYATLGIDVIRDNCSSGSFCVWKRDCVTCSRFLLSDDAKEKLKIKGAIS